MSRSTDLKGQWHCFILWSFYFLKKLLKIKSSLTNLRWLLHPPSSLLSSLKIEIKWVIIFFFTTFIITSDHNDDFKLVLLLLSFLYDLPMLMNLWNRLKTIMKILKHFVCMHLILFKFYSLFFFFYNLYFFTPNRGLKSQKLVYFWT